MVGVCLMYCLGELDLAEIERLLDGENYEPEKSRRRAWPYGLTLVKVFF